MAVDVATAAAAAGARNAFVLMSCSERKCCVKCRMPTEYKQECTSAQYNADKYRFECVRCSLFTFVATTNEQTTKSPWQFLRNTSNMAFNSCPCGANKWSHWPMCPLGRLNRRLSALAKCVCKRSERFTDRCGDVCRTSFTSATIGPSNKINKSTLRIT